MALTTIAIKNLKRNLSFYSLYFLSVSFVLMICFCFLSFSKNEIILEKISSDGRVEMMCSVAAVFIMAFVIFYLFYSNRFFMRRRMKELGIYALLGYRKSRLLLLLTTENFFLCSGGMIVGILFGSLLHKGVTAGIVALLNLAVDLKKIPFFDPRAVLSLLAFLLAALSALILSNALLLWRSTLLDLIRLEKKAEKPVRPQPAFAFTGLLLLLSGYALALDMMRQTRSLWIVIGFSPTALLTLALVVAGTVLILYSAIPYVCWRMRKHRAAIYRENAILFVPKFMHRIRTNANSLIFLIFLAAGTLAVFGATALSVWYPYRAIDRIVPSAIEYRIQDRRQSDEALEALAQFMDGENYGVYETRILEVTASSDRLPEEYSMGEEEGRTPGFDCIRLTDYAALRTLQGGKNSLPQLGDGECVLIKYRPDPSHSDLGAVYRLDTNSGSSAEVSVLETSLDNPIGFANSVATLVVSDELYAKLAAGRPEQVSVISIDGPEMRSDETAYTVLKNAMPDNPYLASAWQRQSEILRMNSSTFLLIAFATIIFLIATGSILYFQNLSAIAYDRDEYEILWRIGYDRRMLRRYVRCQIRIYFIIPYLMGLLHSIFAILCYRSALIDDVLGRTGETLFPVALAIGIFSAVYFIYYQVTKISCYKAAIRYRP